MELFTQDKDKVIPRSATLLVKEFKAIWDKKDKEQALKELAFVYYLTDYKSVYMSTDPSERESIIIEDLGLSTKWKQDKLIQDAIKKYKQLQETPTMRLLQSAQEALEQLVQFFKTVNLSERDKSGKPVHKPSDITRAMSETAKVAEALDKLSERVKKELDIKGRVQGGGEVGLYEDSD